LRPGHEWKGQTNVPLKDEIRNELNAAWAAGQKRAAAAAAPDPVPPWAPVTAADVDAALAKCSTDELARIVETAGPVPMVEWRQLSAEQRRALRASNMLAARTAAAQRAAAKTAHDRANAAEQQAVERRQQHEAQAAAEREPFLEKKREEYRQRGW
jgi:hypothetical protein